MSDESMYNSSGYIFYFCPRRNIYPEVLTNDGKKIDGIIQIYRSKTTMMDELLITLTVVDGKINWENFVFNVELMEEVQNFVRRELLQAFK